MSVAESYVSLDEAAAAVKDGDTLALGGVTLYRRPLSFVKELLPTANAAARSYITEFHRGLGIGPSRWRWLREARALRLFRLGGIWLGANVHQICTVAAT